MNKILKRAFMPSLLAASLAGVTLVPAQPASADKKIIEDIGIGAGAGVVSGAVRGRGNVLNNALKGAAAGAAVNAANGARSNPKNRNLGQDAGVGAAASTVTGTITRPGKDTLGDAVDGAVAGTAIHILRNRK